MYARSFLGFCKELQTKNELFITKINSSTPSMMFVNIQMYARSFLGFYKELQTKNELFITKINSSTPSMMFINIQMYTRSFFYRELSKNEIKLLVKIISFLFWIIEIIPFILFLNVWAPILFNIVLISLFVNKIIKYSEHCNIIIIRIISNKPSSFLKL